MTPTRQSLFLLAAAGGLALAAFGTALGKASDPASTGSFGSSSRLLQQDGEAIYRAICQGCHMPEGEGAEGAGAGYPALADNELLEGAGYPIYLVLHGQNAMPPFGGYLDDSQVAAVVTYIRTHFGNDYTEPVTSDDVAAAR